MIVIIAFTILASYWPVLLSPFSMIDDVAVIQYNPRYLNPTFRNLILHFTEPDWDIFAPLTYGIWHVISALVLNPNDIEKIHPHVFKLTSILIHILSALACLRLLIELQFKATSVLLGTLVFALHPVQVESVAWTTGLKDELCGLFSILSIGFYLKYLNKNKLKYWKWTFVCVVAAILSKPTAVILPLILFSVDLCWAKRKLEKRFADAIYFIIPAVVSVAVMIHIQRPNNIVSPLWSRPLVMLDSLCFYLYKIILPINLVSDYGRAPADLFKQGYIYWTWIFPVICMVLLLKYRSKYLFLAAILFVFPILPVSGIRSFDMQQYTTVADHYLYQSLTGVGVGVAYVAGRFKIAGYLLGVISLVLGLLAFRQSLFWLDQRAPLHRNAILYPDAVMPRAILAMDYLSQHRYAEAERMARDAVNSKGRANDCGTLALSLYYLNRTDEADQFAFLGLDRGWNNSTTLYLSAIEADKALHWDAAIQIARRWAENEKYSSSAIKLRDQITIKMKRAVTTQPATMKSTE